MDKFIEEIAKELIKKYNKENNTHFAEWWEIHENEEKKRRQATIKCLNRLYELGYIKEVK